MKGERQLGFNNRHMRHHGYNPEGIRNDHTSRYYFVNSIVKDGDVVLDSMCGIGYGSHIIASARNAQVHSFDGSQSAVDFAKKKYWHPRINYSCHDYLAMPYTDKMFNVIVSYEAIEHIPQDETLLHSFHRMLKDDGTLILSTPNQNVIPFGPKYQPEHLRHYRPEEIEEKLTSAGFKVTRWLSQPHKLAPTMNEGPNGIFMIVVCEKA